MRPIKKKLTKKEIQRLKKLDCKKMKSVESGDVILKDV